MATSRSPGQVAGTTALPPATDIRAPKSAFALISSAVPQGADSQDGGAVGPEMTHSGSRGSPIRDTLPEGFSHFATPMTAPIASGRSDSCRVGLAPTEERRLTTAHTQSRHFLAAANALLMASAIARQTVSSAPFPYSRTRFDAGISAKPSASDRTARLGVSAD